MKKPLSDSQLRHSNPTIDCSEPVLTDQSYKKTSDINNIVAQYQKTGLLQEPNKAFAKYVDNTLAIPLEQAYALINEATALFHQLPSSIRKQMDNDPRNLEQFIQDPDNHDQLLKHGILIPKQKADEGNEVTPPQPPAGSSENIQE